MKATSLKADDANKRHLHSIIAGLTLLLALAGFAQSYYLKSLFGGDALSALLHLHGLVMTMWLLLFMLQVRLIATRKHAVHRRVGMWGMGLGVLVMVIGIATAIDSARRAQASPGGLPFLATSLGGLFVFVTLVVLGLIYRRQRDFHSRFMLLANLSIIAPAIARLPLDVIERGGLALIFIIKDVCILAFVLYDLASTRRLHPATAWASLLIIVSYPVTRMIGATPVWIDIAKWLVS
ncbi:hypothetical protein [Undibacterium flavidum]|uniref:DUF2306 domain-containing protein n=1 Tax=Undibacterium flavidum TaxID=2762297 RepID=A0ABR6Y8I2_9BURK|nr:hypothetical protein [Undibacterium flavidum]MBC3872469.1 hypothetical protein [Undibacterium flavidum]